MWFFNFHKPLKNYYKIFSKKKSLKLKKDNIFELGMEHVAQHDIL
jgi:hypothetical protein